MRPFERLACQPEASNNNTRSRLARARGLRENSEMDTLNRLEQVIAERKNASPDSSYVAKLNAAGIEKMAQKLGEEATEAVIASLSGSREELVGEAADVIFHLLVLLQARRITLDEVITELDRREGTSGLDEKASRSE